MLKLMFVAVLCHRIICWTLCTTYALLESHSWATGAVWIARWLQAVFYLQDLLCKVYVLNSHT